MKYDGIPKYECCECCDVFEETTEFERCPLCGSHHVFEISFDRLLEWMITHGPDQDRTRIAEGARKLRNKWGFK